MLVEIHQQEGKVVAEVDRRHPFVELERIERHRLAPPQAEITEMQIAMCAPDKTVLGAPALPAVDARQAPPLSSANHACTGSSANPALRAERTLPSAIQRMVSATATLATGAARGDMRPPHRRAHRAVRR